MNEPRRWHALALAASLIASVIALAIIASVTMFVFQHHESTAVSAATAAEEFARARLRFAGQVPLVQIRDGDDSIMNGPRPKSGTRPSPPRTLYVLVFDSRSQRLVRTNLPLNVLGLIRTNGFRYLGELTFLDDTEFDADRLTLTVGDIEERGPGLVLDHAHDRGGQFIAWSE